MNIIKIFFLFFTSVNAQLIGSQEDPTGNGCVLDGGYSWCPALKKCVRSWVEPCQSLGDTTKPFDYIYNHIMKPDPSDPLPVIKNKMPDNCATWFDGCNTCQVEDGKSKICTLMYCHTKNEPYCMNFNKKNNLKIGDICYRFCEDNSKESINKKYLCPDNTKCISSFNKNSASMVVYDSCDDRAWTCQAIDH